MKINIVLVFVIKVLLVLELSASSIDVCFQRPYIQTTNFGKIKISSVSYSPYSSGSNGLTKVYSNNKPLYSIAQYFHEYLAISTDGKYLYAIDFQIGEDTSSQGKITEFKNGVKTKETKFSSFTKNSILGNLEFLNESGFRYWSKYYNDEFYFGVNSRGKEEIVVGCVSTEKVKSRRVKTARLTNKFITIHNDELYIVMIDNFYLKISLSNGKIKRLPPWEVIYDIKQSDQKVYRKFQKYKYLKRGKFPELELEGDLEYFVKNEIQTNSLFDNLQGNLSLGLTLTINS